MRIIILILLICLFAFSAFFYFRSTALPPAFTQKSSIGLSSPAFFNDTVMPEKYTCRGKNVSPPLVFSDVPANAESLALIFEDPDAPFQVWDHWLLWNIPPSTFMLIEGSIPAGVIQGTNSFGNQNYGGPCPATSSHQYNFNLYALDTTVTLPPEATKKDLLQVMRSHILGQTQMIVHFP